MASALDGKVSELERMEAQPAVRRRRVARAADTADGDDGGGRHPPRPPGLTGDAAAAASLVSQEIRHLNRLVHDLIEISRFDAGTAHLVADDTEVATAAAACLRPGAGQT